MPTRNTAPTGAPCWADLWTSDVPGARRFYGELFGWEADNPQPQFGGYFTFLRDGVRIAGGMGDMGEMRANNTWKIYLATGDIDKTLKTAQREGAQLMGEPMAVADLGSQALLVDPTGASLGLWQPDTFQGFTVFGEHGTPTWFELHTRDYKKAVNFYRAVFGSETNIVDETDEFRYTTLRPAGGGDDVTGIMDATRFLPAGAPATWYTYWHVDDVDAAASTAKALGGSVVQAPENTPYGRLATLTDHAGAQFKLHASVE
jgi:predicted enzyme related to lactoylglutathione lyase